MPDFHKLTKKEAQALGRFERARKQTLRLELSQLAAQSRVRVARAVSSGLTPTRRTHARLLASLARRAASGYDRLEHLGGAVRYARRLVDVAAREAGLTTKAAP
jgi:hypothetical protein